MAPSWSCSAARLFSRASSWARRWITRAWRRAERTGGVRTRFEFVKLLLVGVGPLRKSSQAAFVI